MAPAKIVKLNKEWMCGCIAHLLAIKSAQVETKQKKQRKFSLDNVEDNIKTTKTVKLAHFETRENLGITQVWKHFKWVNTVSEPPEKIYSKQVITEPLKTFLEPVLEGLGFYSGTVQAE